MHSVALTTIFEPIFEKNCQKFDQNLIQCQKSGLWGGKPIFVVYWNYSKDYSQIEE